MQRADQSRFDRRVAMTTEWENMTQPQKVENLNSRLHPLEEVGAVVDKVYRYIKFAVPLIVTAAISSGVVSGKWGAFLHALFTGSPG